VDEVLLVDGDGRFTEGTTCAIAAVVDGVLWTAPHDGRILVSTTLCEVVERAERLGIPVKREGPPASGPWDALYVCSTTRELAPVVELDGKSLPGWDPVGTRLAAP
jgi:branched-subunit amino acid aminotransferase/4-amino-4-deoxychorismate lyase